MTGDSQEDQVIVRELLARELETINNYYALMQRAQSTIVKNFIQHVIDEEKDHIAEAFAILRQLDPIQAAALDTGGHIGLIQGTAAPPSVPPVTPTLKAPQPEEVFPRQKFTVGSLRRLPQGKI